MKVTFPLPTDGKMHRLCLSCKADSTKEVRVNGKLCYKCTTCYATNNRTVYFNNHKFWVADDNELWHEGTGVFVRNENNKFLFFTQKEFPYRLTVPSGHVDIGETSKAAAERELKEEAGLEGMIRIAAEDDVYGDSCSSGADCHKWHAYVMDFDGKESDIILCEEGESPQWLSLEDAKTAGLAFVADYMVEKYSVELLEK